MTGHFFVRRRSIIRQSLRTLGLGGLLQPALRRPVRVLQGDPTPASLKGANQLSSLGRARTDPESLTLTDGDASRQFRVRVLGTGEMRIAVALHG